MAHLQIAYRTQKAIGLFNADKLAQGTKSSQASTPTSPVAGEPASYQIVAEYAKPEGKVEGKPEGNLRCGVYSRCGRYFAWASTEGVSVVDASTQTVLSQLPGLIVVPEVGLGFSPRGTYLATLERPAKDEAGDAIKNLKIWHTIEDLPEGTSKEPLGQFVQKSQSSWNLQYTADEKFCARVVTNEVQFYESHDLKTVWNKLRVEGVTDFALAAGSSHNVAVFVPERKGQPAAVKVFNVPHFTSPVSQKTFFKGDKVQMKWNQQGSSLIVLAQTDVDKSNKSYYGETTLYLLSANGTFDARVTLDKDGPIHDVTWSPTGREFGVVYGYMPAKTTVFNHRGVETRSFPMGPRNTVNFSPNGRFALVAGFGNLAGQIDIYDLEKDYRKVCTIESGNPSVCEWSPDSVYIMTATTSPRLRVDNGIKLWHVGGSIMYSQDMDELYNVSWRPVPADSLPSSYDPLRSPVPHASAVAYLGTVKTPSKPVGAYRPPGARGASTPLHFKREDQGGSAHIMGNGVSSIAINGFGRGARTIPGADFAEQGVSGRIAIPGAEPGGDANLSKQALKNKKKRGNKKAKEGQGNAPGCNEGGLAPPPQEYGSGSGGEDSRRARRGVQHNYQSRSRSRNPHGNRGRSNTQHNNQDQARGNGIPQEAAGQGSVPGGDASGASQGQDPKAKKLRGLQKKVRAIEELEMRRAGGEKLEETQLKKISTKADVLKQLEDLEKA